MTAGSRSSSAGPLAITGGTVVTPDGARQADVLIRHGTIVAVAGAGAAPAGAERLDATGCFVLPGGVDPHGHIMADVAAATRAAALGGTTTVLSFTNPGPGEGTVRACCAAGRNSPPPRPRWTSGCTRCSTGRTTWSRPT